MRLKNSVSMISEFKDNPPERTLDLGCGVRFHALPDLYFFDTTVVR
jgi:hypothetical protein